MCTCTHACECVCVFEREPERDLKYTQGKGDKKKLSTHIKNC